jgi:hypothetical protein
MVIDWRQVGDRMRVLVGANDDTALSREADRLKIGEAGLRSITRRSSASMDLHTLAAVVRAYGLDPTWVLTGEYDSNTHRSALNADTDEIAGTLLRLTCHGKLDDEFRSPS